MVVVPPHRIVRPRAVALLLAGIYVLSSAAYVVTSTHVAAVAAQSVAQLEKIERLKGVVFVVGSGALFYGLALYFLRRAERQREAIIAAEHRSLSGLFAASVAHDINNVAMIARLSAELMASPSTAAAARAQAEEGLRDALVRLGSLSQRLMTLGRDGEPGVKRERDLVAAIERAVGLARRHESLRRCRISTVHPPSLLMPFDEALVDRVLLNLLLNAAEATRRSGRVEVRLRADDDNAVIEVHDNGPGVPEEIREEIFDPFFTSKTGGLGLGLMSVRLCADAHGGSISVGRSDLGGAVFALRLPRQVRAE